MMATITSITEEQALEFQELNEKMVSNIVKSFVGKDHIVRLTLAALVAGGHILLEDVPGTGKTHLARAISQTINGTNKRIQFTPDLLPSDITGISVYDQKSKEFVFHQGPIFANIVLADEINRTSPKTQSALLEVMEEGKVTTENITRPVGDPFLVIATQNPVEQAGTYRLPEAQLDRFLIKTSIGYLDHASALSTITGETERNDLSPVMTLEDIVKMKEIAKGVYLDPMEANYILQIVEATREASQVKYGSSHRGALGLANISRAWAVAQGRTYVSPDDIRDLATVVLSHRLIMQPEAEFDGIKPENVVGEILEQIPVPMDRG
jgi:MoxR-like ATPase